MKTAPSVTEGRETGSSDATGLSEAMAALSVRVRGEYKEMPGLRLTVRQAARLFGVVPDVADAVLRDLRRASVLALSSDGAYSLIDEPSHGTAVNGSLSDASVDRLSDLLRHWRWADEAMVTFDRELARLRRVHHAFGEALRQEQVSREIDSLDP